MTDAQLERLAERIGEHVYRALRRIEIEKTRAENRWVEQVFERYGIRNARATATGKAPRA